MTDEFSLPVEFTNLFDRYFGEGCTTDPRVREVINLLGPTIVDVSANYDLECIAEACAFISYETCQLSIGHDMTLSKTLFFLAAQSQFIASLHEEFVASLHEEFVEADQEILDDEDDNNVTEVKPNGGGQ